MTQAADAARQAADRDASAALQRLLDAQKETQPLMLQYRDELSKARAEISSLETQLEQARTMLQSAMKAEKKDLVEMADAEKKSVAVEEALAEIEKQMAEAMGASKDDQPAMVG
eukprot:365598-Chlamydomonas_euryale.AAC.10